MNSRIYIFIGSKKDFEKFLDAKIPQGDEITYFMDLIKDYNANLRQQHAYLHGTIEVKILLFTQMIMLLYLNMLFKISFQL